jgi:hypothetical protein
MKNFNLKRIFLKKIKRKLFFNRFFLKKKILMIFFITKTFI